MEKRQLEILQKNLPEHPGVQGMDKYINSAVIVPLVETGGEFSFLFQKRSASIRQGSDLCFPGGVFDVGRDRDLLETALREIHEELLIGRDSIKVLGRLDTVVAPMGVTIDPFVGVLSEGCIESMEPNRQEVEDVFTLPVRWFRQHPPESYYIRLEVQPSFIDENGKEVVLFPARRLGLPERYYSPWGHKKYRVYAYTTQKGVIWGVTAEIIYEVVSRCYGLVG